MEQRSRHSEKRDAIWTVLQQQRPKHLSAEQVYHLVREQYPQISLGTVYRNLSQFKSAGKIKSVGVIDGQERFDANVAPHAHFVCRKCGLVLDLHLDFAVSDQMALVMENYPVLVERQELVFHGLCSHCREEAPSKN
ncbi:MAG: transcriptional repressor [Oscillospiraceae bacterium]|nr:transcriptional repressor [Oscillospiraceae bacterium]